MATNALLRTPSSLYRIRTCSTIALSLLPRRPIATNRHASTLPPKQPRRSNGQFLAGCAEATILWTALWLCLRSPQDETAHDTAQDPNLTDQELEQRYGDLSKALKAFCALAGLGPDNGLRYRHDVIQPVMLLSNPQGEEVALQTELHRFELTDLPADTPSLVGFWWQIPPFGNGDHDAMVYFLTAIMKGYDERGEMMVPGYAVALTQWKFHQIIWEYKDGELTEVRRFSNSV